MLTIHIDYFLIENEYHCVCSLCKCLNSIQSFIETAESLFRMIFLVKIVVFLSLLHPSKSKLKICNNISNESSQICRLNELHKSDRPPGPNPAIITPILSPRNILSINTEEKSVKIDFHHSYMD